MKLDEFKAWFEGFTEDMDRAPTAKQWKRIKERVAEIDGVAISYPVYVERYVQPWYPYGRTVTTASGAGCTSISASNISSAANCYNMGGDGGTVFDATSAMYSAGKAEAASFNA